MAMQQGKFKSYKLRFVNNENLRARKCISFLFSDDQLQGYLSYKSSNSTTTAGTVGLKKSKRW